MKTKFVRNLNVFNITIGLLIINLIIVICFPVNIFGLFFFKVPLKNLIYHIQQSSYLVLLTEPEFYIPLLISNILTIYLIPFSTLLVIENLLIKYRKIQPKVKVELSKKKKIILYSILIFAILAYLVSLGGWIHTMIPYSPEELEQLRYD